MSSTAVSAPGGRLGRAIARSGPPLLTLCGLIALWELALRIFQVPSFILPRPTGIIVTAINWTPQLITATRVTLIEVLAGFVLGSAIAIPLAFVVIQWGFLRRTLYPILLVLQSVPKVAIAPILVVWLGFGISPKIVVAILICFFPVFVDTAAGFASTPRELLELARSLRTGRINTLLKFRFPHALPNIFTGLKVGVTLAVIGAVVGEFVQSSSGLGYLIQVSATQLNTALGFACIAILSLMGIGLFYAIHALEYIFVPWSEARTSIQ